jgi:hypothetical protein
VDPPLLAEKEASMLTKGMAGDLSLILELIFRDLAWGVGSCFFDSEGSATEAIIARIPEDALPRVFLLDPVEADYFFALNLFECDASDRKQVANTVTSVVQLFSKLVLAGENPSLGSSMEDLLRTVAHTMIANPGRTMADVPLLLTDATARDGWVRNVSDPRARLFWDTFNQVGSHEYQAAAQFLLGKVQKLLDDPYIRRMVGQARTTVDFSELLETGSLLLVKLPPAHWQLACIVCYGFVCQFLNAAYARRNSHKHEEPAPLRFYADGYTWRHLMLQQG